MDDSRLNIKELQQKLKEFAIERDWEQFHSPKNLVMALSGESGELVELFQWLSEKQSFNPQNLDEVSNEIADIFLYLVRLCDQLKISLPEAVERKLKINAEKYPISLSKGIATKYTKLR